MMGTFGGALEERQIDASNGKLTADVTGEVEAGRRGCACHSPHSRGDALGGARSGKGNSRAYTRHLRHALPALSHIAQGDRTHFLIRVGDFGSRLLKSGRQETESELAGLPQSDSYVKGNTGVMTPSTASARAFWVVRIPCGQGEGRPWCASEDERNTVASAS
jgi:hypothetical protein